MILYSEQHHLFHLSGENMSYIVNSDGKSLYWGASINPEDCVSLSIPLEAGSFDPVVCRERQEFPVWDGRSFSESCLQAEYPLFFKHVNHSIQDETLEIYLEEPIRKLTLTLRFTMFSEYGIIARSATLRNAGKPLTIQRFFSASWNLPQYRGENLRYVAGKWAGEFQIINQPIQTGEIVLQSRRGITSHHFNPSFAISEVACEEQGDIWFGMLGYSGDWKIIVERTVFGNLHIQGGRNDTCGSEILGTNETLETPVFYGGFTQNGFGGMSRILHSFEREHIAPPQKASRVLFNSWEATLFDVTAKGQMQLADVASKMGIELFVVDDGWFGGRDNDYAGLGDWYVNEQKFPQGLQELINYVNHLGMDFGIWVEPEAINPDSDLYRAHPDWIYRLDGIEPMTSRNQYVLNFSLPEVQSYLRNCIHKLLSENNITFLKWDMNRPLTDVPNPSLRRKHVDALYDFWRWLRREFPHVELEGCSGGGGRVDAGVLKHANQFWISDNTDPFDRLLIQEGFSQFYSPAYMMCWVTDTPDHGKRPGRCKTSYKFHSAMCGGLGIGSDIIKLSDVERAEYKQYILQYKELRQTIQFGKLYRLLPAAENLTAVEYIHENEVVVFAFLHSRSFGDNCPRLRLRGLDSESYYRSDEGTSFQGKTLLGLGLPLNLSGDFDSVCMHLKKIAK